MGLSVIPDGRNAPNFGYNIDEGLRRFRWAVADVDRNPVRVAVIGDSMSFGYYASDILETNWTNRLRKALQAKLGDVGPGSIPIPLKLNPDQPKWTLTSGWTVPLGNGLFGRYMQATGGTDTATVTFTGTACDLIYAKAASGASAGVSVTIDGVAQAAPNCYNATGAVFGNVVSYTGLSAGAHTMVITAPASGNVFIEGLFVYNPQAGTPKGCYVFPFATPSLYAQAFSPHVAKQMAVATPHLTIVALGINDSRNLTYFNNYMTHMGTIISGAKAANSDVLLLAYGMIGDADPNINSRYRIIVQYMKALAQQYNCAMVSVYDRWGTDYAVAQVAGMHSQNGVAFNGDAGNDPYHLSDKGHRDVASSIIAHLLGGVA